MKFSLITAVTALSTLASGMVVLDTDTDFVGKIFRPDICIQIHEAYPDRPYWPSNWAWVYRSNGSNNVKMLLGFKLPGFTKCKSCTISFSDATSASGSRTMQLFTIGGYPAYGNTWNKKPYTDVHKGTFQTSTSGSGPAKVLEDYGLTFPCPKTATDYEFEVQPVNDNDSVTWDCSTGGFIITCG